MNTTTKDKAMTNGVLDDTLEGLSILNELQELHYESNFGDHIGDLISERPRAKQLQQLFDDLYNSNDSYSDDPITLWLNDTLEFRQLGYRTLGDSWVSTGMRVTLSWGGPNVYLTVSDSDNLAQVDVYWGGDHSMGTVLVPQVISAINELLDAYDLD